MSATVHAETAGFAVHRVLAAFDPATASADVLETVIDAAVRLGADLDVLFVEDEGLLGLAELPFVRQVGLHGLPPGPLVRGLIEAELHAQALRLERRLTTLVAGRGIAWTFRSVRGRPGTSIAAAAEHADLLIIGAGARPIGRAWLLEPSLADLVARVRCPVLLHHQGPVRTGPVHVLLEAARNPERLLATATSLAGRYDTRVVVVPGRDMPASLQGGILVVDAAWPQLAEPEVWRALGRAACRVLLIR